METEKQNDNPELLPVAHMTLEQLQELERVCKERLAQAQVDLATVQDYINVRFGS